MSDISLEDIASLAKRRGFIYQGSDIYGGLAGTWDYGPLGVALKRNVTNLWWRFYVDSRDDMYGIDSAILMNPRVWEASGHVAGFTDPLIEDVKTKKRYRLDHLLEDAGVDVKGMNLDQMATAVKEHNLKSPDGNELANPASFNLLFKTSIGAIEGDKSAVYLRGETAQGMFVNFKNIIDSFYPDLPFGIAQIGRCFRNEISPRDFIFRVREFEIMEFEYFIDPAKWEEEFEKQRVLFHEWFKALGLPADKIHELEVPAEDRAHYSKRTIDFEFAYPFGVKEIGGLAYRTDFDLTQHEKFSGKNLKYTPKAGGKPFVPHVLEPTFGLDRHVLAVLANAYTEDEMNGEKRVFLKLPKHLAPVKVAVSPLLKNKPELVAKAREVYDMLKKELGAVMWDDNGNIGKRYRRQDEIGTPFCVTIDFQTLEDNTVTVRDRDTATQTRLTISRLNNALL
ncbi:MAG TPA: glycine--tRNA ligase [Candidatus Saccharimonadales bacterium]|jgi:glycyl-tRNA synthetase|nr:glycine--tRNA ligase [Candidatus Saccharimonadales bacterium]